MTKKIQNESTTLHNIDFIHDKLKYATIRYIETYTVKNVLD